MMTHYERFATAATHHFAEPGHFFEFLPDALLKGDVKTRWEAYKAAREAGAMNADEIRKRENMSPIGGAAGSEYWRPANMAVSGEPNPPSAPPPPAGNSTDAQPCSGCDPPAAPRDHARISALH